MMMYISLAIIVVVIAFFAIGSRRNVTASGEKTIHSREALVVDIDTDQVLYEKHTTECPVPIASITKLMTFVIVTDNFHDLSTRIVVDSELISKLKARGASMAGLKGGYSYSVIDLLYGLMLPSGCDAAEVLASYFGNQSFVRMMNEKAQKLGMYDTRFVDASGLGTGMENDVSTAKDIYILFKYLINKPIFVDVISTFSYAITGMSSDGTVEEHVVKNTNSLIDPNSQYYSPHAVGGKTGTLSAAGRCLVTLAEKEGRQVAIITLGVPNESSGKFTYHLTDTAKLIEIAFGR